MIELNKNKHTLKIVPSHLSLKICQLQFFYFFCRLAWRITRYFGKNFVKKESPRYVLTCQNGSMETCMSFKFRISRRRSSPQRWHIRKDVSWLFFLGRKKNAFISENWLVKVLEGPDLHMKLWPNVDLCFGPKEDGSIFILRHTFFWKVEASFLKKI